MHPSTHGAVGPRHPTLVSSNVKTKVEIIDRKVISTRYLVG